MEVLAALGLSAMVIGAALSLLQATRQHGRQVIDAAQQRLDAYAGLSVIAVHGRLAGYGLSKAAPRPAGMPDAATQAASEASAKVPRILPRDDQRLAVFGDRGDPWAGIPRRGDGPQPVLGSERLRLRYHADKVTVWRNRTNNNRPADCEGVGLARDAGAVTNAHLLVLADAYGGDANLHCATSDMRAGGPVVPGVASLQFAYWLRGEESARCMKQMTAEDWAKVIGFDVCLTMHRGTKKVSPTARRVEHPMARPIGQQIGNGHDCRNAQDGCGDLQGDVGEACCHGPYKHHRTVALRNKLY